MLIILPNYLEDFLYCLTVAQTYLMFGEWKLKRKSDVFVRCDSDLEFLAQPVFPFAKFGFEESDLETFDVVLDFDRQRALSIGETTKKHLVDSYGILCGASPEIRLPTVGAELSEEKPRIVLVQRSTKDFRGSEYVYPFKESLSEFQEIFKGADIVILENDTPVRDAVKQISSAAFCAGVVGGFTLLAASMMIPVLELYPEKSLFYREWAAKWATPFYRVIPAEIDQVPARFFAITLDKFIGDVSRERGIAWRSTTLRGSSTPLVVDDSIRTVG